MYSVFFSDTYNVASKKQKKKNNGKRGLDDINLKDYNTNLFQDRIHCTPKTCGFNFWVIKIFKYKFWCFTLKLV